MTVGEIALRQETRQLMAEAGINQNTIKEMAEKVLKEEIEKRVKQMLDQVNTDAIIRSKFNSYEFRDALKSAIRTEVRDAIDISVNVVASSKD